MEQPVSPADVVKAQVQRTENRRSSLCKRINEVLIAGSRKINLGASWDLCTYHESDVVSVMQWYKDKGWNVQLTVANVHGEESPTLHFKEKEE